MAAKVAHVKGSTCAVLPCDQVSRCALTGGCVKRRFPEHFHIKGSVSEREMLKDNAPALNGTKPSKLAEKAKKRR